jgi:hypothetical protein
MALLHTNRTNTDVIDPSYIKPVYNFSYRMSGSRKVAEVLTEKAFVTHHGERRNEIFFIKKAWKDFQRYYGCIDFVAEGPIQEVLVSMPPETRCAVILRDIMGYPYEQIVEILDISHSDAAELISTARQHIARRYKNAKI